jgi:NAD-dependent DNA ligase
MTDTERYIISRWLYSIGEDPKISDEEYNRLHKFLVATDQVPEYTNRSWSSDPCPVELLKKFNLEHTARDIMLRDKTESMYSITTESEFKDVYGDLDQLVIVSYKHDGWNSEAKYYNGKRLYIETRGRSGDPLNVDMLGDYIPNTIDMMGEVVISFEINLSHINYQKLKTMLPKKELVSQRQAVRTAIANEETRHLLTFTAFDITVNDKKEINYTYTLYLLGKWGFTVIDYKAAKNYDELVSVVKTMSDNYSSYTYLADGLVVRMNEGRSSNAVRILSWKEKTQYSFVLGYNQSRSSMYMGMVIKIYPIRLEQSTQREVNITNLKRIVEMNLEPGAPVAFKLVSAADADIDADATRMLHILYKNRWEDFQFIVEQEEKIKLLNMRVAGSES